MRACVSLSFFLFSEGDLPRVTKQELRKQSGIWRERPIGDHCDVSGVAVVRFVRRTADFLSGPRNLRYSYVCNTSGNDLRSSTFT